MVYLRLEQCGRTERPELGQNEFLRMKMLFSVATPVAIQLHLVMFYFISAGAFLSHRRVLWGAAQGSPGTAGEGSGRGEA